MTQLNTTVTSTSAPQSELPPQVQPIQPPPSPRQQSNAPAHPPTPMRRIHVYLPKSLAERMDHLLETEGFKGPSEFVRFMIKYFEFLPPTAKRTNLNRFRAIGPFRHRDYLAPPQRGDIQANFFTF